MNYTYSIVVGLSFIQGRLDAVDVKKAVSFILSCMNFDGGFGCIPGSESHAGQVGIEYTAVCMKQSYIKHCFCMYSHIKCSGKKNGQNHSLLDNQRSVLFLY